MKTLIIAYVAGVLGLVIKYPFYSVLTLVVLALLVLGFFMLTAPKLDKIFVYRFVIKPGYVKYADGKEEYLNVLQLAKLYNLGRKDYILYNPYQSLLSNDIILPPLTDSKYEEYKQEVVEYFLERQRQYLHSKDKTYTYGKLSYSNAPDDFGEEKQLW